MRKGGEKTRKTKFEETKKVLSEETQLEIGEGAREKVIGQTQRFFREKTRMGQAKIDVEKVGGEARAAAVGETSSRVTKNETRKRGLGGANCGEEMRPGE